VSQAFESSSSGALADDTVLECGVCWWVYDPARGEDTWDTAAPGTPFTALPEQWRCPSCDAPRSKFMALEPGRSPRKAGPEPLETRLASLLKAYERAEENMLGLPVHNDLLRIEAVGFRPHGDDYVGVVVTPWSMNLTVVPSRPDAAPPGPLGGTRQVAFPSGNYSFLTGRMEGVGTVETCSLFSPMDEFDDPDVARSCAEAAMEGLFEAPEPPKPKAVSRRFVLTLNGGAQ